MYSASRTGCHDVSLTYEGESRVNPVKRTALQGSQFGLVFRILENILYHPLEAKHDRIAL